jgi:hypothetical protein
MKDWQPLARIDELTPSLRSLLEKLHLYRRTGRQARGVGCAGTWVSLSGMFVSGGDDVRVGNERQAAVNAAHSLGTNVIAERDYE